MLSALARRSASLNAEKLNLESGQLIQTNVFKFGNNNKRGFKKVGFRKQVFIFICRRNSKKGNSVLKKTEKNK
jgi:hypothetical protein